MLNALKRFITFPELNTFGVSFPCVNEAKWLTEQSRRTPDLGYLEQFEFQLLFCPDDTRRGYKRYGLIEDGVPLATAYTQETFCYWVQETQARDEVERVAIPMRQQHQPVVRYFPPALKIKGELHAVRPYQFKALDDYKDNRHQFRRQRVNLLVPYRVLKPEEQALGLRKEFAHPLRGKNYWFEEGEKVYVIRAWMYVGIPEYWDNLFDGGFRGFKTVNHYESRRPWLREYYDFPKQPLK